MRFQVLSNRPNGLSSIEKDVAPARQIWLFRSESDLERQSLCLLVDLQSELEQLIWEQRHHGSLLIKLRTLHHIMKKELHMDLKIKNGQKQLKLDTMIWTIHCH